MEKKLTSILLVDDDEVLCQVMARAFATRGLQALIAYDSHSALSIAEKLKPEYAVVDLRMPDNTGLQLVPALLAIFPSMRIIMLTGYASINTAVEAIKLGAVHYLTKPADADEIISALSAESGDISANIRDKPMSLERLEWEHIQKVLGDCDGNISAAARQLGMHRRTLQRKLSKRPAKLH